MLYQRCLNAFLIHTKIRFDNIFLKQMGQSCSGQVCCKNHQNDNELPQMQVVTPLKMHRHESKQSLFVVDEEKRATIYQGLIGQDMDDNDEWEEQKQPNSPLLKLGKIQSQMQIRAMFTPIKRRKLRRVQTLADERLKEDLYNQFFNENINSPVKQQEETDKHSDFWEFTQIYQKIMREYEVHNLDSACQEIIRLEKLQISIKTERNITQEQFDKKLKEIQEQLSKESNLPFATLNRELIAYIKALLADMNYYYDLAKKDPYQEKYNKKGIKISTRRDGKNSAVLIQTETKDPFENITAFFNDVRYFPDFIPFCENSYLVKDCGRNSKVAYSVFNFPVISKREAFFQGSAFNRLNYTNQIVLYGRTIHNKPHLQAQLGVQIVPNEKYVQMEFNFFVITYQPLSKGVGKLKFAANFDYGISFIPSFVEQYAIKDFGKQMFDNMMNISENFKGSKWEQSIQKDPGIFLLVREIIDDYLNKKQTEI